MVKALKLVRVNHGEQCYGSANIRNIFTLTVQGSFLDVRI